MFMILSCVRCYLIHSKSFSGSEFPPLEGLMRFVAPEPEVLEVFGH